MEYTTAGEKEVILFFGEEKVDYESDLKRRTKVFAHRAVKFSFSIQGNILGNHIAGQLMRSATSVAANYRAACIAQSLAAFVAKLSIVIEEVDEAFFWIEFAVDEDLKSKELCAALLKEAAELTAIFISSRKTANKKLGR